LNFDLYIITANNILALLELIELSIINNLLIIILLSQTHSLYAIYCSFPVLRSKNETEKIQISRILTARSLAGNAPLSAKSSPASALLIRNITLSAKSDFGAKVISPKK